MARARNIKPGFYKNEDLAECSVWARLMFPGLWMLADREGRIEDRPKRIKGELFPYDSVEVDPLLQELVNWGFINRYIADGKKVIAINNFLEHQYPHGKEADSELPDINGVYTVNERDYKSGCVTGKSKKNETSTVQAQDKNQTCTVQAHPESGLLNPESLNPVVNKTHTIPESEDSDFSAGSVCLFLREMGIVQVNPAHPDLIAALVGGATKSDFEFAATEARNKGKGFAYLLGIVLGKLEGRKHARRNTKAVTTNTDSGFAEKYGEFFSSSAERGGADAGSGDVEQASGGAAAVGAG